MKRIILYLCVSFFFLHCSKKEETTLVVRNHITESVYASGLIKSIDQYQVNSTVNGIVEEIYVIEGDTVNIGSPLMKIASETQELLQQNAKLAAQLADLSLNREKIKEAETQFALSSTRFKTDSSNFIRQKNLWEQKIGSKAELEQRELAYLNSKTAKQTAQVRLDDLKRQLAFNAAQTENNLRISKKQTEDYIIRSEIEGKVYQILKQKGELALSQNPLLILGDGLNFILEMQVDEYDITRLKPGMEVIVTLDSYRGEVFKAKLSRIYPIMNERNKTFLVEALFDTPPTLLYPNLTFEASIVIQRKKDALIIPRSFLVNDSTVILQSGDEKIIQTGLKDFRFIEVLSGLNEGDELTKPGK